MPAKQFQPRPPIPGVTEKRPQVSSAPLHKPGPPSAFPLTSKCGPPAIIPEVACHVTQRGVDRQATF